MPRLAKPIVHLACVTDPGEVRSDNEDSVAGDAAIGFAVLADGMGGHNAGEVASRIAVDVVNTTFRSAAFLGERLEAERAESFVGTAIAAANSAVLALAGTDPRYRGMGTTLLVAFWHDNSVTYGHVGDSRLYLLRAGKLERLTRDHTIVQQQFEQGRISAEEVRYAANRNVLTRAVGIDTEVEADLHTRTIGAGDLYLLCSDGLTDMMTDDEIGRTLLACRADVNTAAVRLVELANEAGGHDNISVVIARVLGGSS
jgi:PPM family protein phosphatase